MCFFSPLSYYFKVCAKACMNMAVSNLGSRKLHIRWPTKEIKFTRFDTFYETIYHLLDRSIDNGYMYSYIASQEAVQIVGL